MNVEIKLYRETFLLLERAILQRKMSKVYEASSMLVVNCAQCAERGASIYCDSCRDHFCPRCSDTLHTKNAFYGAHTLE